MFTISCLCNFFESLFRSGRIAGVKGGNCGKIAGVLPRIGMRVLICNLLELLVGLFGALFRSQKTLLLRVNRSIGLTKRRHIGTQRASHGLAGPLFLLGVVRQETGSDSGNDSGNDQNRDNGFAVSDRPVDSTFRGLLKPIFFQLDGGCSSALYVLLFNWVSADREPDQAGYRPAFVLYVSY
jgi:hypothetical protein